MGISKVFHNDLFAALCGEKLGEGQYRHVYAHRSRPDLVVKIEQGARSWSNIEEWNVWREAQDFPKLTDWFAPCEWISGCGSVLLQKRTSPVRDDELPKQLPAFFCDLKRDNFGMLNGKFVCHDYGNNRLYLEGFKTKLSNKVESWT